MPSFTVVFSGGACPGSAHVVEGPPGSIVVTIALLPPLSSKGRKVECTKKAALDEIVAFFVASTLASPATPLTVMLTGADGAIIVPAGPSIDPVEARLRVEWGMPAL